MLAVLYVILMCVVHIYGRGERIDQHVIACRSTDFDCFKRQYRSLRDNILLGNEKLGIPAYENYVFRYGKGTCVKLAGLEESELIGISMQQHPNKFTMRLMLPLRIQQVKDSVKPCAKPEREFVNVRPFSVVIYAGTLMRFTGNATISIAYPFKLKKKKGEFFMSLEDEDLDVILDVPDLSHFDMADEVESKLYEWSEWAYEVIQHIDAAQYFALPYTSQMKKLMDHIALRRLISLYPEESFMDLEFSFKTASKGY
ncbi:uncharacterized protein LOC142976058 isoform X2 [Anticarsia gemmatalis]|uniref:uncharacterized protein LOC142976058 isoform X2 n=1 Tax=Anticarsia gemmatalis TaxID=129554 RepID=UPI003F762F24